MHCNFFNYWPQSLQWHVWRAVSLVTWSANLTMYCCSRLWLSVRSHSCTNISKSQYFSASAATHWCWPSSTAPHKHNTHTFRSFCHSFCPLGQAKTHLSHFLNALGSFIRCILSLVFTNRWHSILYKQPYSCLQNITQSNTQQLFIHRLA